MTNINRLVVTKMMQKVFWSHSCRCTKTIQNVCLLYTAVSAKFVSLKGESVHDKASSYRG